MTKLLVVGGGRMGEALVAGLLARGWPAADLAVLEPVEARRRELANRLPGVHLDTAAPPHEGALIAVKPPDVEAACAHVQSRRVVSIAAGVPLAKLEAWLPGASVVRAMPNTPAQVGAGATAIAAGTHADDDDLAWASAILSAVGTVVRVPEKLLDAVTGLSGSGPAYVFLVAEALIDAGVHAGLPRDIADALARQTLLGAALLLERGDSPESLRAAVTSPGGTTAAGLRVLEDRAVRAAFLEAVLAATHRSRELG